MLKLLVLAGAAVLAFRWLLGAWPWEYLSTRPSLNIEIARARRLLGVRPNADPADIRAAHRRLAAIEHPDRGGSNARLAALNAARDLLLANPHHK